VADQASPATLELAGVIRKYLHAFSRADAGGRAVRFVVPGIILEGMPPHLWSGVPEDAPAEDGHLGRGDFFIAFGEPRHDEATADPSRIVLPASTSLQIGGREVRQTGALFTLALRETGEGWCIGAWAWAKRASGD
jgi:hypothetical protein